MRGGLGRMKVGGRRSSDGWEVWVGVGETWGVERGRGAWVMYGCVYWGGRCTKYDNVGLLMNRA